MFHKPLCNCPPDAPWHEYLPPDGSHEGADDMDEE